MVHNASVNQIIANKWVSDYITSEVSHLFRILLRTGAIMVFVPIRIKNEFTSPPLHHRNMIVINIKTTTKRKQIFMGTGADKNVMVSTVPMPCDADLRPRQPVPVNTPPYQ
ncbi:hypothetical protein GWI33_013710 [Rhynchophorus ferrugineus]|uniref:Uncharacterized protein n=1 Tax=Rhynchophorus ferrugineus TaxID=354439 RepID=A0A834I7M0_RHYFE|nr:hypothetical protein GWI33_013710 [Rhynchophorus ferrugineus]